MLKKKADTVMSYLGERKVCIRIGAACQLVSGDGCRDRTDNTEDSRSRQTVRKEFVRRCG